jgi:hypothetical protein
MSTERWPPGPDDYFHRRVLERLEPLRDVTDLRRSARDGEAAVVGVWPYDDDIAQAVAERRRPLTVTVVPEPRVLPTRYSKRS